MKRRDFLKTSALAVSGMMLGSESYAGESLVGAVKEGVAPIVGLDEINQDDPRARMQAAQARKNKLNAPVTAKGKLGNLEVSRLILGGNPFGGWLHSRDLNYVGDLAKAYLTEEKVMNILQMAENCGINTIAAHPIMIEILNKYWNRGIGKIQWISDCGGRDFAEAAKQSIDGGCAAGYCQGENTDRLVAKGDFKSIEKGLQVLRDAGKPAGIGAHNISSLKACVENGVIPDFWFKTLHHLNYWSAMPDKDARDNRYCMDADETIAFMAGRKEPFVAFKVMAAGAIRPEDGIQYGVDNGGDFLCLGMFDFNMIEDINIFNEALKKNNRKKAWLG